MDHTFTVHGITLNMEEMRQIHDFYRICDLSDFLVKWYPSLTAEKAMSIAAEAYAEEFGNDDDFEANLQDILEREGVKYYA